MSLINKIILIGGTVSTFSIGFWLSYSPNPDTDNLPGTPAPQASQAANTEQDDYVLPFYQFAEPFNARKELELAATIEDTTERYGRMIAIGCYAARQDPEKNLVALAPEIWIADNYDLRGAFHSEWMRSAPDTFLPYAETKYAELLKSNQTDLFPSYHLSYMEPIALLDLLPRIKNPGLKTKVRNDLLGTLVELAPNLLWENREQIASVKQIIDEATNRSLFELALQFWELSDWEQIPFDLELHSYLAKNERLDYASKLTGYEKVRFAVEYAHQHPAAAAAWVREQNRFSDIEYEFDPEHAAFFSHLFATEDFQTWHDAPLWICESISSDEQAENYAAIFSAIRKVPESCHLKRLKDDFYNYLNQLDDTEAIKDFYLAVENDHPVLGILEHFMLQSGQDFNDAIVARTTRQSPTPERLMRVLEMGNLDSWPDAYFAAARDTLNALSDQELLWSLSPGMILSAQEIAPERIQNLLSTADPQWLFNSLKHFEFTANATIENLPLLPELLKDLPPTDAQEVLDLARGAALRKSLFDEDKLKYVNFAKTESEAIIVASTIEPETYLGNSELRKAIEENPHRDDIYLTIANKAQLLDLESLDPHISQALSRIEAGKELIQKTPTEIVSTIQSLPSSERFLTAKAILMANGQHSLGPSSRDLIDLPIWSKAERQQLQSLNYTQTVNYSLQYGHEIIW